MRRWAVLLCLGLTGCGWQTQTDKHIQMVADTVIRPALERAMADTAMQNLQIQGGLHGINPKYRIRVKGLWVTGFDADAEVGLEGIAGQIMGASTGLREVP